MGIFVSGYVHKYSASNVLLRDDTNFKLKKGVHSVHKATFGNVAGELAHGDTLEWSLIEGIYSTVPSTRTGPLGPYVWCSNAVNLLHTNGILFLRR